MQVKKHISTLLKNLEGNTAISSTSNKETIASSLLKSIILFSLCGILLFASSKSYAQGYIDCATILNNDAGFFNSSVAVKNIDGYTYIFTTPWHYDPLTSGSFPVI